MRRCLAYIITLCILTGCSFSTDNKELELGIFSINLPKTWRYKPVRTIDSFGGEIVGQKLQLNILFSKQGFSDSLTQTEEQYIKRGLWSRECYFCKPGVTYISSEDATQAIADEMKKRGIKDPSLVKIEPLPNYKTKKVIRKPTKLEKSQHPNAEYIADLTYFNKSTSVPIEIPEDIKRQNFHFDTTGKYIIKTMWPKVIGKGTTGVYIKSRTSALNMAIAGKNLSAHNQELALRAFKTIRIAE